MLSRRQLLALGSALALTPRRARAATTEHRKFLFLFARGGWDPSYVFAPGLDPAYVDSDPDGRPAVASGISYLDAPNRPAVRAFFEQYGGISCVVNGVEVRSLTHERCRRLILCGGGEGEADDWAVTLAGETAATTLPHLVLSGPAFAARFPEVVVRVGANNQLAELLTGDYVVHGSPSMGALAPERSTAAAAFARKRAEAWAAASGRGQPSAWGSALLRSYDQLDLAATIADRLAVDAVGSNVLIPVPDLVQPALRCFAEGISRCAIVEHLGMFNLAWDTHSGNDMQASHFQTLFDDLLTIAANMESTPGTGGGSLLDETTVVVLSEMGRTPKLNAADGKDHWTFTSTMLFGGGVRGGQVIGGFERGLVGRPVDLATGALDDTGTALLPEHLGATLYALAGLDAPSLIAAAPIDAAVDGA